jgi:hypothetical protein
MGKGQRTDTTSYDGPSGATCVWSESHFERSGRCIRVGRQVDRVLGACI